MVFNSEKIAGMFALKITLCFLTLRHYVFRLRESGSMLEINLTSSQKQVTDVSLSLKDSDKKSENLGALIQLSVLDGQKQTVQMLYYL